MVSLAQINYFLSFNPVCLSMLLTVDSTKSFLGCGTVACLEPSGLIKMWWLPLTRSRTQPFFLRMSITS